MDHQGLSLGDSPEESHRPPSPSCSAGSATHFAKKPAQLRIVVPPTEYCPFSTDLALPITPLFLPTPFSSSCFTFDDTQEPTNQSASAPLPPDPFLLCARAAAVADFASPTSSQFLLMPPTPHVEHLGGETEIRLSPLAAPDAANEPTCSGSHKTKSGSLHPWEVSSSTWLSDLGGHTETDRTFRRNLLEITSVVTESSPTSTPALSSSAVSPSSQVSSTLADNLLTTLARSRASLPPVLLPFSFTMSSQLSSPTRLVLKPTGTDTFPSALDNLQAWRASVTPGPPQSEDPHLPLTDDVHSSRSGELGLEMPIYSPPPSHRPHSHPPSPRASRVSRSQTLLKHAKMFGGRVKRLVTWQNVNRYRDSMDRDVNFNVVTSQVSESSSVILITAPPPPCDARPLAPASHSLTEREHAISECSSEVRASTVELATTAMTELGSGQVNSGRNALRRLSLAALSTIKRF